MKFKVAVVSYQEDEYQEIKRISTDGNKLEATWTAWKQSADKRINQLKSMGLQAEFTTVHPVEFQEYCKEKELPLVGKSRAEFAQHLLDKNRRNQS